MAWLMAKLPDPKLANNIDRLMMNNVIHMLVSFLFSILPI